MDLDVGEVRLPGEEGAPPSRDDGRTRLARAATRVARALGIVVGSTLRAAVDVAAATLDEIADKVEHLD